MQKGYYSNDEIIDMLEKAEKMGFFLSVGSVLEDFTIEELDALVNQKAN